MNRRIFVIGVLLLGACGDGLGAPAPLPGTSGASPTAAEPAAVSRPPETKGSAPVVAAGRSSTTTIPAMTATSQPVAPQGAPVKPPPTADIPVPDTEELDALLDDIDGLMAEFSNSLTGNEGDVSQ